MRVSHTFDREDGSQAKLVVNVQIEPLREGHRIDVVLEALKRPSGSADWQYVETRATREAIHEMSILEYEEKGRAEMFRVFSRAEILKCTDESIRLAKEDYGIRDEPPKPSTSSRMPGL